MSGRRLSRLGAAVAAVMAGFALVLFIPAAAQAAPSCDNIVNDGANVLGSKTDKVKQAAQALNSVGADTRVLTVTSFAGYATLDDYVKGFVQHCGSWRGASGDVKTNLVVFAMSNKEHKLGIFYGSEWNNAFTGSNSESAIYSKYMTPRFKDGDFGQGFVDGINRVHTVLNEYLNPGSVSSKPAGKSHAVLITLIVIGSILFIVFVAGGIYFYLRRRRENEACEAMRQRAIRARDKATEILGEIGDATSNGAVVRKAKVNQYSAVSASYAKRLQQAAATLDREYKLATNAMPAAVTAAGQATDKGLGISQYEALAERYEEAQAHAEAAQEAAEQIDNIALEVKTELDHAAQKIATLGSRLDTLAARLMSHTELGVRVDTIQASVDQAQQELNAAKQHQTDLSVLAELAAVEQLLTQGETAEQQLNQQRTNLATGLPALGARIGHVTGQVNPAREAFERISPVYAESSWAAVKGNGTEAEKRITMAQAALAQATTDASLDRQQWSDAIDQMTFGNQLLDEAEALLRSIIELESNLAAAKQNAPSEIDAAQSDIDKAEAYLRDNRNDVRPRLIDDLRQAKATLAQAEEELGKDRPDYLQVVKTALQANHHADDILAEAVQEHEAVERLRRQAESMLREAASSVNTAENYIDNHSHDVRSGAKDKLRDAKRALAAAQQTNDPVAVLKHAKRSDSLADDAYDDAQRDHRRAENERNEERRRRNSYSSGGSGYGSGLATGLVLGDVLGSSSNNSSSWGSSGGGGFDFGGSSSSFDSGSGLGGSSGGW